MEQIIKIWNKRLHISKKDIDMSFNKILVLIFLTFLINSCADYKTTKNIEKQYFSSNGFALIYNENLFQQKVVNKKMKDGDLRVMHSTLKANTPIKIINPENLKEIETKVFKKALYPKIFNIVVSEKAASILELDKNNPYVEIIETKKNETFIAKEGSIFDEEKNVAEKAPVNEVKMDDLTKDQKKAKKNKVKNHSFIIVISDFYYVDSANNLKKSLEEKISIKNMLVKKINDNKYRLLIGPFENFSALKTTYISLNNLGFDNLNVYKE